jgi:hypothetical protein
VLLFLGVRFPLDCYHFLTCACVSSMQFQIFLCAMYSSVLGEASPTRYPILYAVQLFMNNSFLHSLLFLPIPPCLPLSLFFPLSFLSCIPLSLPPLLLSRLPHSLFPSLPLTFHPISHPLFSRFYSIFLFHKTLTTTLTLLNLPINSLVLPFHLFSSLLHLNPNI